MAASKDILDLVNQLPATDAELQKQPAPGEPAPSSKFTGPDPALADKLGQQILAGGRDGLNQLLDLIHDPDNPAFTNYKPEYLLHCLTLQVGRPDRTAHRKLFVETLAARLTAEGASDYLRLFLIRELQWVGDDSVAPALGRLLNQETFCDAAAATLASIGTKAAEQFRHALPGAKGRVRLVLIQALGEVKDAASADALLGALQDELADVRMSAAWGLARLGDGRAGGPILDRAEAAQGWERVRLTSSALLLAENLAVHGKKLDAQKIYLRLRDTRTAPDEQHIRDAAGRGLGNLGVA